jgi:PHD/YefM family antitoxin component YafN of YafNO toxin-antitoxin module
MLHPETASYSDFPAMFDRVQRSRVPTIVKRGGKAAAVVLSPKAFRRLEEAQERLATLDAVEQSIREVDSSGAIPWEEAKATLRRRLKARIAKQKRAKSNAKR